MRLVPHFPLGYLFILFSEISKQTFRLTFLFNVRLQGFMIKQILSIYLPSKNTCKRLLYESQQIIQLKQHLTTRTTNNNNNQQPATTTVTINIVQHDNALKLVSLTNFLPLDYNITPQVERILYIFKYINHYYIEKEII